MRAIIYISEPNQQFSPKEIRELNIKAVVNNASYGVSGFLCFHHNTFIQYIEGDESHVNELFQRIQSDSRHTIKFYIEDSSLEEKRFPSWQMKLIESELLSELSVEPFLHKQLELMKTSMLGGETWEQMIWRGVDIIANKKEQVPA